LSLPATFSRWHRLCAVAARGHHHAKDAFVDKIGAGGAEAGGQETVGGGGGAAALHIAEDGDARFEMGQLLELPRQAQGVAGVFSLERVEFQVRRLPLDLAPGLLSCLFCSPKRARVFPAHRPFGHTSDPG